MFKFVQEGLNDNWLPVWIQPTARTYYEGKLANGYWGLNWNNPYPRAWTNSTFLIEPWTYNCHNSTWTNGDGDHGTTNYLGEHTTDVTTTKALDFIDDAADSGEQFFLMIAPVAPDAEMKDYGDPQSLPPAPAEFASAFNESIAPRTPNFNPDTPSSVSWVYNKPKQTDEQVDANDDFHRHRLRNLAGIDLLVASVIQCLEDRKLLDNTYIIFTSDNGFHVGNHRLDPGKPCGSEEDINILLLVRGPGMPAGLTINITNSHTDIAPTVLTMMGIPLRDDFDGQAIAITEPDLTNSTKYEHVNVEFWDSPSSNPWVSDDGDDHAPGSYYNNTYKSLRINSAGQSSYYSVWCTGEKELYDVNADQYQMSNLLRSPMQPYDNWQYFSRPYGELVNRLDALLMVLQSCKQDSCRDPYSVLFPKGQVVDLTAAMDTHYDKYFGDAPRVSFETCFTGSIPVLEGPMVIHAYSAAARSSGPTWQSVSFFGVAWSAFWYLSVWR